MLKFLSPNDRSEVDEILARIRLDQRLCGDDTLNSWPSWLRAMEEAGTEESEAILLDLVQPWFGSINSLKQLPVVDIVKSTLTPEQMLYLDTNYPMSVESPDGSQIPVTYICEGPPTATAKLQQFFGTQNTPCIGPKTNAQPIKISLLSPAGRPLAETLDLPFFWKEVYPSIRSEMRGRYPKHPWPEDPLSAVATRKTKKQMAVAKPSEFAPSRKKSAKKRNKK
jgi:HrpA-like RNA helicase